MHRKSIILVVAAFAAVAAGAVAIVRWTHSPQLRRVELADGSIALFYSDSTLSVPGDYLTRRNLDADGEFWIRAVGDGAPLVVRSRLLVLTVQGPAKFHLVARSSEAGEQVEVLKGRVVAAKNYPSSYVTPDELGPGEMSMVNQSIDLQEKEKMNEKEFAVLRAGFRTVN